MQYAKTSRIMPLEQEETLEELYARVIRSMNAHGRPDENESKPPSISAEVTPVSGSTGTVRHKRVLVVDDEADFAANLKEILETYGYTVQIAADGFRAVDMVREEKPDTILLDMQLPRMNGLETFRRLKEITPDIHAIMMTGYAADDLLNQALREGARASLKKPLDFSKLVTLLEEK